MSLKLNTYILYNDVITNLLLISQYEDMKGRLFKGKDCVLTALLKERLDPKTQNLEICGDEFVEAATNECVLSGQVLLYGGVDVNYAFGITALIAAYSDVNETTFVRLVSSCLARDLILNNM